MGGKDPDDRRTAPPRQKSKAERDADLDEIFLYTLDFVRVLFGEPAIPRVTISLRTGRTTTQQAAPIPPPQPAEESSSDEEMNDDDDEFSDIDQEILDAAAPKPPILNRGGFPTTGGMGVPSSSRPNTSTKAESSSESDASDLSDDEKMILESTGDTPKDKGKGKQPMRPKGRNPYEDLVNAMKATKHKNKLKDINAAMADARVKSLVEHDHSDAEMADGNDAEDEAAWSGDEAPQFAPGADQLVKQNKKILKKLLKTATAAAASESPAFTPGMAAAIEQAHDTPGASVITENTAANMPFEAPTAAILDPFQPSTDNNTQSTEPAIDINQPQMPFDLNNIDLDSILRGDSPDFFTNSQKWMADNGLEKDIKDAAASLDNWQTGFGNSMDQMGEVIVTEQGEFYTGREPGDVPPRQDAGLSTFCHGFSSDEEDKESDHGMGTSTPIQHSTGFTPQKLEYSGYSEQPYYTSDDMPQNFQSGSNQESQAGESSSGNVQVEQNTTAEPFNEANIDPAVLALDAALNPAAASAPPPPTTSDPAADMPMDDAPQSQTPAASNRAPPGWTPSFGPGHSQTAPAMPVTQVTDSWVHSHPRPPPQPAPDNLTFQGSRAMFGAPATSTQSFGAGPSQAAPQLTFQNAGPNQASVNFTLPFAVPQLPQQPTPQPNFQGTGAVVALAPATYTQPLGPPPPPQPPQTPYNFSASWQDFTAQAPQPSTVPDPAVAANINPIPGLSNPANLGTPALPHQSVLNQSTSPGSNGWAIPPAWENTGATSTGSPRKLKKPASRLAKSRQSNLQLVENLNPGVWNPYTRSWDTPSVDVQVENFLNSVNLPSQAPPAATVPSTSNVFGPPVAPSSNTPIVQQTAPVIDVAASAPQDMEMSEAASQPELPHVVPGNFQVPSQDNGLSAAAVQPADLMDEEDDAPVPPVGVDDPLGIYNASPRKKPTQIQSIQDDIFGQLLPATFGVPTPAPPAVPAQQVPVQEVQVPVQQVPVDSAPQPPAAIESAPVEQQPTLPVVDTSSSMAEVEAAAALLASVETIELSSEPETPFEVISGEAKIPESTAPTSGDASVETTELPREPEPSSEIISSEAAAPESTAPVAGLGSTLNDELLRQLEIIDLTGDSDAPAESVSGEATAPESSVVPPQLGQNGTTTSAEEVPSAPVAVEPASTEHVTSQAIVRVPDTPVSFNQIDLTQDGALVTQDASSSQALAVTEENTEESPEVVAIITRVDHLVRQGADRLGVQHEESEPGMDVFNRIVDTGVRYQRRNRVLQPQNTQLRTANDGFSSQNLQLHTRVGDLETRLGNSEACTQQLSAELQQASDDNAEKEAEIAWQKSKILSLEDQLEHSECEECPKYKAIISEKDKLAKSQEALIKDLKEQLAKSEARNGPPTAYAMNLEHIISEHESTIDTLQSENASLRDMNDDLRTSQDAEHLEEKNLALAESRDDAAYWKAKYESEHAAHDATERNLKSEIESTQSELKSTKSELRSKNLQLKYLTHSEQRQPARKLSPKYELEDEAPIDAAQDARLRRQSDEAFNAGLEKLFNEPDIIPCKTPRRVTSIPKVVVTDTSEAEVIYETPTITPTSLGTQMDAPPSTASETSDATASSSVVSFCSDSGTKTGELASGAVETAPVVPYSDSATQTNDSAVVPVDAEINAQPESTAHTSCFTRYGPSTAVLAAHAGLSQASKQGLKNFNTRRNSFLASPHPSVSRPRFHSVSNIPVDADLAQLRNAFNGYQKYGVDKVDYSLAVIDDDSVEDNRLARRIPMLPTESVPKNDNEVFDHLATHDCKQHEKYFGAKGLNLNSSTPAEEVESESQSSVTHNTLSPSFQRVPRSFMKHSRGGKTVFSPELIGEIRNATGNKDWVPKEESASVEKTDQDVSSPSVQDNSLQVAEEESNSLDVRDLVPTNEDIVDVPAQPDHELSTTREVTGNVLASVGSDELEQLRADADTVEAPIPSDSSHVLTLSGSNYLVHDPSQVTQPVVETRPTSVTVPNVNAVEPVNPQAAEIVEAPVTDNAAPAQPAHAQDQATQTADNLPSNGPLVKEQGSAPQPEDPPGVISSARRQPRCACSWILMLIIGFLLLIASGFGIKYWLPSGICPTPVIPHCPVVYGPPAQPVCYPSDYQDRKNMGYDHRLLDTCIEYGGNVTLMRKELCQPCLSPLIVCAELIDLLPMHYFEHEIEERAEQLYEERLAPIVKGVEKMLQGLQEREDAANENCIIRKKLKAKNAAYIAARDAILKARREKAKAAEAARVREAASIANVTVPSTPVNETPHLELEYEHYQAILRDNAQSIRRWQDSHRGFFGSILDVGVRVSRAFA